MKEFYEEERVQDGWLQIRTTRIGDVPDRHGWKQCTTRNLTKRYLSVKAKYEMLIDIVNTEGIDDE